MAYSMEELQAEKDRRTSSSYSQEELQAEKARRTPARAKEKSDESPGLFDRWFDLHAGPYEATLAIGTAAIAEPIAGLIGGVEAIGRGLMGEGRDKAVEEGAETVGAVQEALTYEPMSGAGQESLRNVGEVLAPVGEFFSDVESGIGDAVLEYTGNPELAAIAHTLPTALMEGLGMGALKKTSTMAEAATKAQNRPRIEPNMTDEAMAREVARDMEVEPEDKTHMEIMEDLRKGKAKKVAAQVKPDETILRDAEELGGLSLNPGDYSTSESFRRVQAALKQAPDSHIAEAEIKNLQVLSDHADDLIKEFGGVIDRGVIDIDLRTKFTNYLDASIKASDREYALVKDRIPVSAKATMDNSRAFIDSELALVGGNPKGFTKPQADLAELLDEDTLPNWERLDRFRREIANGYKGKGIFKDEATGNLDQVYKVLSQDQQKLANQFKVGPIFAAARKNVRNRKIVEKRATQLIGKELTDSILPKIKSAASRLSKGDVSHLKKLMEALPASQRASVAATMLGDLFATGARNKSFGQGFISAADMLNRNPTAKAELFKHIPDVNGVNAERRFDAIANVSKGIFRAKQLGDGSPTSRLLLGALSDTSLVSRLFGRAIQGTVSMVTGHGVAGAVGDASASAAQKGVKRAKRADDLMLSPQFNKAIDMAAEGRVKEAEIMLRRSKAWQAWRKTVGEGTRAQLLAQGPIAWLTQPPPQEGQPVGQ